MPLLLFACLGLVASQISGVHMHVDSHGYAGSPAGTHVHSTALDHGHSSLLEHGDAPDHRHSGDPDHEGDRDVITDLGVGASKLLIFFASFGLLLIVVLRRDAKVRLPVRVPSRKTRRIRWRPPLRAPPFVSHSLSH
jgi:hypothetical protein